MPLSEREKRILEDIERGLYKEDRRFARDVQRKAPRMKERRRVRAGVALFGVGLAILIAFFVSSSVIVGVIAFAAMVSGIVLIANSFRGFVAPRRPSGPGLNERMSRAMRSWEEKIRRRYKR